jgi:hypothetical protein
MLKRPRQIALLEASGALKPLFLEKILESLAGIVRAQRATRGFLLHHHAH